jgi:predicted ATPase
MFFYQSRKGKFFLLTQEGNVVEVPHLNFLQFKEKILEKNRFTGKRKLLKFLAEVENDNGTLLPGKV